MFLTIENAVGEGFRTLGIGMMIVIGVLALLMATVYLLIPLFSKIADKKPKEKKTKKTDVQTATPTEPTVENDESDVIAAIIAAISAQTGASPASLKVVSFKRLK